MKRVSIELNFHSLYSNFLDCLNNETLNSLIILETFRNIRVSKIVKLTKLITVYFIIISFLGLIKK